MGGIPIIYFYLKKIFLFIDLNKQTFIMVHFVFSQGLRSGLAVWFGLRVFREIVLKNLAHSLAVIWAFALDWRIHFQDDLLNGCL